MQRQVLLIYLMCVLISGGEIWGQQRRTTINYDLKKKPPLEQELNISFSNMGIGSFKNEDDALFFSIPLTVNIENPSPFLAFNLKGDFQNYDTGRVSIFVRFARNSNSFGNFEEVRMYHHSEVNDSLFQSELMFINPQNKVFQFLIIFHPTLPGQPRVVASRLQFDLYSPGEAEPVNTASNPLKTRLLGTNPGCGCDVPAYVSRTAWGAPPGQNYNLNPNIQPSYSPVSHLVIHHSAGSNTSSNWSSTVSSIWNFHVNSNGWDDIGYNWLIDPNGMIYEGRGGGNNVVGAHFCGKNTGTMGICMLGTYENVAPTAPAMESLHRLLAWKLCDGNLDALDTASLANSGLILPVITGHKAGCSTLCPGDMIFQNLPVIKQNAVIAQTSCVTSVEEPSLFDKTINIYPNPSEGVFNLKWWQEENSKVEIRVLDGQGRNVLSQKALLFAGPQESTLDLNHLVPGIYWLQFITGNESKAQKIVLMR